MGVLHAILKHHLLTHLESLEKVNSSCLFDCDDIAPPLSYSRGGQLVAHVAWVASVCGMLKAREEERNIDADWAGNRM